MVMTEAAPDRVLAALQGEDPSAAERLVAHYGDRAYRLAIGITCNAQDAEEAVQDAFWSAIRQIGTFRGDSALGSWIYRIVLNAAYQKLRGRARRRDDISLDEVLPAFDEHGQHAYSMADWSGAVDDPAVQSELRTALEAAIAELPVAHRAIILLHDVEGVRMADIAASLGITLASAKTRAHRARLLLRKRLANFMSEAAGGDRILNDQPTRVSR
jgi:RNA polymerase sigma-70 factor (ECF subfamily)